MTVKQLVKLIADVTDLHKRPVLLLVTEAVLDLHGDAHGDKLPVRARFDADGSLLIEVVR